MTSDTEQSHRDRFLRAVRKILSSSFKSNAHTTDSDTGVSREPKVDKKSEKKGTRS